MTTRTCKYCQHGHDYLPPAPTFHDTMTCDEIDEELRDSQHYVTVLRAERNRLHGQLADVMAEVMKAGHVIDLAHKSLAQVVAELIRRPV